jgi:hypothetical protein
MGTEELPATEVTINIINATIFICYPSLKDDFFIAKCFGLVSNHLQVGYIGFYENYYTYNGSVALGLIPFLLKKKAP